MSGVFMDGGGHDHMGHGFDGSHGGGDGFTDGGHDHGGHDHGGHDHGGHDHGSGNILTHALGLDGKSHHGHNFLSHLLGLDADAHDHGHMHDGSQVEHGSQYTHVSQMPIWTQALQSIKLSNFTDGIVISANFWLLIMFLSFIGWLFVVYWIRHHEPMANSVIGTAPAHSSTAAADRRMIAGIKEAFPVRVSADGGEIYAPIPGSMGGSPAAAQAAMGTLPAPGSSAMTQMQQSPFASPYGSVNAPTYAPAQTYTPSQTFVPTQNYVPGSPYVAPLNSTYNPAPYAQLPPVPQYQAPTPGISYAPVMSPNPGEAPRLRMVVNR